MSKVIRIGKGGAKNALSNALNKTLIKVQESNKEAFNKALRKTYIDVLNAVILKTPVDTGTLRNSWFLDTNYSGDKLGSASGSPVDVESELKDKDVGEETWYFYNNQPYAYRIEYEGYSDQASRGMLRVNLTSFNSKLRQNWKKESGKL